MLCFRGKSKPQGPPDMKPNSLIKWCAWLLGAVILLSYLGGRTTKDYALVCTRCLAERELVEYQLWGVTYWSFTRPYSVDVPGHDVSAIYGKEDFHTFRKMGSGEDRYLFFADLEIDKPSGDQVFQQRIETLRSAFKLNDQFRDIDLLRRTYRLLDAWIPPDTRAEDWYKVQVHPHDDDLIFLWLAMQTAKTHLDWEAAVAKGETAGVR
jgi:hypothetical protein